MKLFKFLSFNCSFPQIGQNQQKKNQTQPKSKPKQNKQKGAVESQRGFMQQKNQQQVERQKEEGLASSNLILN